jgi:hypothetical protein
MNNLRVIPSSRFNELPYNPLALKKGEFIQETFDDFKNIMSFHDPVGVILGGKLDIIQDDEYILDPTKINKEQIHKILSLAILITDRESPLVKAYRNNWKSRKADAINRLNITSKEMSFAEYKWDGRILTHYIFEYFKIINDTSYEAWFSAKMAFHQMGISLRNPLDDVKEDVDVKQKIIKTYFDLQKDLEKLDQDLFPDKKIRKLINQKSIEDAVGGYAEKYARIPDWQKEKIDE